VSAPTDLPRLLAGAGAHGGATLATHLAHHGLPSLAVDPAGLIAAVEESGLHGRGGAAFPTATKLHAVARGRRRAVVVANGAEGEPASQKDAVLLAHAPHLVLDGAQLAARAVGASEAIVCVRAGATAAQAALATALDEREQAGRDAVALRLAPIEDGYVGGEESALVHQLNGGPPQPTFTPPRPFERGVGGRPTLVQNVETLAHVALIARHGSGWFRALGTDAEPGSALVTLSGAVARPGVREIALGTSLETLVAHGDGELASARAVLLGGYFGAFVPGPAARGLRLDVAHLRPLGASLGAGVVAVLPGDACVVAETARVVSWLAQQSARQCGPCLFGLAAIADLLRGLVDGRAARARQQAHRRGRAVAEDPVTCLRRWSGDVEGRGACRHPDGVVRLVRSALDGFAVDFDDHARHGACDDCLRAPVLPLPERAAASRVATRSVAPPPRAKALA
jgi:NADH:ubiquinone oxidoreductase subunit F (NADH-binding)